MTTVALIFSFVWWAATLIFAAWWAERRYRDGYEEGYRDARRGTAPDSHTDQFTRSLP